MKISKRIVSFCVVFTLMFSLFTAIPNVNLTVSADEIPPNAIHIKTADELKSIGGEASVGKYYVLDNDINLTSEWTPIDNFQGTFDGQGYTVNNLYVLESSNEKYGGLFGSIDNATVKNVGINIASQGVSASSDFSSFAGGLIGDAWNSTIMNCYVIGGMISAYSSQPYMGGSSSFAGMLIGFAYNNIIINCYATGNVSASASNPSSLGVNAGGLIGKNDLQSNTITSCYRLSNQTVIGENIDESGIPLTPEQMRTQSSFAGWDFNTVWTYQKGVNNDYPILRTANISLSGVKINPNTLTLDVWRNYILTATVYPDNAPNKNVMWDSSNSNIVSVDSNGRIVAKSIGTAIITVTTIEGGYTDTCVVTVTDIDDENYHWDEYPDDPDYDYWDGLDWHDNPPDSEYWNDETWFDKETDDNRDIPSPCDDDGTIHPLTSSNIKRYTVLVLDISGSMKGKPLAELKKASKEFCDYIINADEGNYISIVAYSSKSKIKQHFTNNYQVLASVIDNLKSGGATNIFDGLSCAERLLDSVIANNSAVKQIFLMSDGLPNTGLRADTNKYSKSDYYNYRNANAVFNKASELKSYGYQILTLGFFHANTKSEFIPKRLRFAIRFMNEDLPSDEYRNAISIVNTPNDLIERFKLAARMLSISTLSNDNRILIENKLSQIPCDTQPTTEPTTQPTTKLPTQTTTESTIIIYPPTEPNPPPTSPPNTEPTIPENTEQTIPTTTKSTILATTKSTPPTTTTKPAIPTTIEPTIATTIEPTTSTTIEPTIATTIELTPSMIIEPTIATTIEPIILIEDTTPQITEPTTTTITEPTTQSTADGKGDNGNNTIRGDDNFYSIDDNGNFYITENVSDSANIHIIDDEERYYSVIHINDDGIIYVIDDNENYYRIDNTTKQLIPVDDRNDDYIYEIVKLSVMNNEILPKSGKFYLPLQLLIAVGVIGLSMLYLAIFRFKREKRLKRKPRMVILCIGILSILSSTGVAAYGYFDDSRADTAVLQTMQILHEQIEQIQEYQESIEEDIDNTPKLIEINGESYIGTLKIPSLNLELPVNNKLNDEIMKNSPCRYIGDISSSMIIVAHNYKTHFGQIQNLLYGDKIVITDGKGQEHWYTVELITILNETEVDAMLNNPYDLTLFTCTLDRKHRTTVRCNKINDENTETDNKTDKIIEISEETQKTTSEIANISVDYPLFPDYDIKQGQNGGNVKLIQQYLNEIRSIQPTIPYLEEDGSFGSATDNAVKIFQKLYDLSVDGVVGQYTWGKLVEIYNSLQ